MLLFAAVIAASATGGERGNGGKSRGKAFLAVSARAALAKTCSGSARDRCDEAEDICWTMAFTPLVLIRV